MCTNTILYMLFWSSCFCIIVIWYNIIDGTRLMRSIELPYNNNKQWRVTCRGTCLQVCMHWFTRADERGLRGIGNSRGRIEISYRSANSVHMIWATHRTMTLIYIQEVAFVSTDGSIRYPIHSGCCGRPCACCIYMSLFSAVCVWYYVSMWSQVWGILIEFYNVAPRSQWKGGAFLWQGGLAIFAYIAIWHSHESL